ncbi:YlxR family protein [Aestuariimicrobium ganziense]|uniref:YlxR family protein n=1 Tax=Aestuariimicrobium ganziense TaxID=2773677 RepID=UPI002E2E892C|nr:YlxR family protein [Aestuariimicrobium ganziense]
MAAPIRTCIGCRRTAPQAELQRYVVVDGRATPDPSRRLPGRGSWLHDDPTCLDQALRRGAFSRSQRRQVEASGLKPPPELGREGRNR